MPIWSVILIASLAAAAATANNFMQLFKYSKKQLGEEAYVLKQSSDKLIDELSEEADVNLDEQNKWYNLTTLNYATAIACGTVSYLLTGWNPLAMGIAMGVGFALTYLNQYIHKLVHDKYLYQLEQNNIDGDNKAIFANRSKYVIPSFNWNFKISKK